MSDDLPPLEGRRRIWIDDEYWVWEDEHRAFLRRVARANRIASPVLELKADVHPNWEPRILYRQGVRIGLEPSPPRRWQVRRRQVSDGFVWVSIAEPWKGATLFLTDARGSPFSEAAGAFATEDGPLEILWTPAPPGQVSLRLERVLPSRPDLTGYWYQAAGWTDGTPSSGRLWWFSRMVARLFDPIPEILYVSTGGGGPPPGTNTAKQQNRSSSQA